MANGEPYMRRLTVIENGVPTTTTPHVGSRNSELKHENDIPDDLSVAFAAGRLAPQKNYAVILQALALAPRWSLVLAGAGPLEQELKEQAATLGVSGRVRFVGVQPKGVVNKYLSMCDAFVQSSLYEGLSLSVLEAMAHGAPCLVSDIASNTHALTTDDKSVGWLLPTDSPERWAAALDFVRDNPEQARAMGRDARTHQQQHYDEDGMYAKYLALITERALT
jgi:glycosyltransferase involved in cell wall biosynthesis